MPHSAVPPKMIEVLVQGERVFMVVLGWGDTFGVVISCSPLAALRPICPGFAVHALRECAQNLDIFRRPLHRRDHTAQVRFQIVLAASPLFGSDVIRSASPYLRALPCHALPPLARPRRPHLHAHVRPRPSARCGHRSSAAEAPDLSTTRLPPAPDSPIPNTTASPPSSASPTPSLPRNGPPAHVDPDVKFVELGLVPAPIPATNPYSKEKAELGKLLFFDPPLRQRPDRVRFLSRSRPRLATTAAPRRSAHSRTSLKRNAPSILNISHVPHVFWDGRAASLEEQATAVVLNQDEMRNDAASVAARLARIPAYPGALQSRLRRRRHHTRTRRHGHRHLRAHHRHPPQ